MKACWERGRDARTKPGPASAISPTWINGERRHGSASAWPMLFPPQGGCLQHRTEAQRRPKGQDAGGTPALPGNAFPPARWGVSGGRLLRKPTCPLWETPVCPRAGPPPRRADHSRVKQPFLIAFREQGLRYAKPVCCIGNIDRQD